MIEGKMYTLLLLKLITNQLHFIEEITSFSKKQESLISVEK